jgi:hypothetical protein
VPTTEVDWSLVWTIAGVIVAVIGLVASILAARRWGSRRTRLQIDWRVRPLVPFSFVNSKGEVETVGSRSPPQFEVELSIKNMGPQDILAEHFEGQPMRLNLGTSIHRNGHWSNGDSGFLDFEREAALIHPRRISADAVALYYTVRCFGKRPDLSISAPPAHVRVKTRQVRDLDSYGTGVDQFSLPGSNKWLTRRVHYN